MGSTGQALGAGVGAVIGGVAGYFGGDTSGGAYLGFSLGMAAGSFIDPPRGQREAVDYKRTDLFYNTMARNMPVPIVYGVNRVGGNLLWMQIGGARIEGENTGKKSGGGGKKIHDESSQKTVIDAAWAVGLSEGEITAVAEVFLGDKRLSYADGISYTAYLGTQSQTADPRLVTDLGTLAPAFRNTAYLAVGAELQSPSIPVINAEISGVLGTPAGDPYGGFPYNYSAFVVRGLEQADGSFLGASIDGWVWRSKDYGETWDEVFEAPHAYGYAATTALGQHKGVAGRAYFAHYTYWIGNIYVHVSDDYGKTWTSTSQVIPESFDPAYVMGVEASSSEVILFTRGYDYNIGDGLYHGAAIFKSHDAGLTFSEVFRHSASVYAGCMSAVQVPGSRRIFALLSGFFGDQGALFESGDGGNSWSRTAQGIRGIPDAGFSYGPNFLGFGGNNPDTGKGCCFISPDGGDSWYEFPVCDEPIQSMKINSFGILLATTHYHNYEYEAGHGGGPHVYYSTTLGTTWQRIGLDLRYPHAGVLGLDQQCLFLTTEKLCFGSGVPSYVTCVDYITPTSCANPALVIRDLLMNTRYGLGISSHRIDLPSFRNASAYCTAQVPSRLSSGHLEQRFCLDYVVDNQQPIVDHLRDMLASFSGYLTWSQGRVKLHIDRPASSTVQSFGMAEIVANSFKWKRHSYRERPNIVRVDYVDPGNTVIDATGETVGSDAGRYIGEIQGQTASILTASNYKTYKHDFVEASDPWDIERTGERREKVLNLTGIKRRGQAQRMAEFYLAKAIYCQNVCQFRVGINALRAEIGDVIAVSHDIPKWAGKLFRIMEVQEAESDELQLGCIEYNEHIYRATDGKVGGQDPIIGQVPADWTAAPQNVGRLTAYARPNENAIEVTYTRVATSDIFGGAVLYRRIGENGAWEPVGTQLSVAPTAYVASHVETLTLVES